MFGLEGSGFIISLAMTFFLVGLVMYYVRGRLNDQERQINQLVSIVPVMTQTIQSHEQILQGGLGATQPPTAGRPLEPIPEENNKINVSDNSDDSDDSDDSDEDDSDEDDTSAGQHDVKNIKFGSEIAPPQDITVANIEEELGNQLHAIAMGEGLGQMRVVSVQMGAPVDNLVNVDHGIEVVGENSDADDKHDPNGSDDSDDSDNSDDSVDDASDAREGKIEIVSDVDPPVTSSVTSDDVDYTKMSVAALRKLVGEKKLAQPSEISKLKKQKCIELLN